MKYLKATIVLLLVFAAGISVGSVVTRYVIKRDIRKAILNPEIVRLRVARELTRELELNPGQQVQLEHILVQLQQDIAKARKERNLRIRPLFAHAQRRIHEMLTPEQQEKFERYQAENGFFSLGNAQGQGQNPGQNLQRLQKLRKLRESMQNNNQSPPPSSSASPAPEPASAPPPTPTEPPSSE